MRLFFNSGLMLLVLYLLLDVMISDEENQSRVLVQAVAGIGMMFMFVYCLQYLSRVKRFLSEWSFVKIWALFLALMCLYYVLGLAGIPSEMASGNPRGLMIALYMYICLLYVYFGTVNGHLRSNNLKVLLAILLVNGFLETYRAIDNPLIRMEQEVINTSAGYVFLMIAPLLMYVYRRHNVWMFFITLALTLMTGKRGALVIYVMVFLYGLVNFRQVVRGLSLNWKTVIFGTVLAAISFYFLGDAIDNQVLRFSNIQSERSGSIASGRDEIWGTLLSTWLNADAAHVLFGHGYYSTLSIYGKVAHNDAIQFLVDYGVFGVALYLGILAVFFRNIRPVKRYDSYLYILLMVCLLIWVGRGMVAGVIRTDSINLFISIGYLMGMAKLKRLRHYGAG